MSVIALDPIIAEAKRRARRRRLLLASIGVIAAVVIALAVSFVSSSRPSAVLAPFAAHRSPLYTVSTMVAYYGSARPDGSLVACESSLLMTNEPGGGCSGVPIAAGYDLRPFVQRTYSGGLWDTRFLRLVGTWDGHLFHLTSAVPATHGMSAGDPNCAAHRSGPVVRLSNSEITELSQRIELFGSGPCGHTYWFQVAAADHRTVSYLRHRFGKSVLVTGFLQPVKHR